jgi:ABC-type multidrug transport system ATPase subunit
VTAGRACASLDATLAAGGCMVTAAHRILDVALRGPRRDGHGWRISAVARRRGAVGAARMSEPLLELQDVTLGYQGRSVLTGIQLPVAAGRWIALVGPNASGKTTLLRAIAGRHAPMHGCIRVRGHSLYPPMPSHGAPPALALQPDELPAFLTVRQCLEVYAEAHGHSQVPQSSHALAGTLGLAAHGGTLVRSASLGTRQKLAIVLALMTDPSVLLLDEVFNGLDFASAARLRSYLRDKVEAHGMSIMLATHSLDLVLRCCDELVLLDGGRLVNRWQTKRFGGPDALAQLEEELVRAQP